MAEYVHTVRRSHLYVGIPTTRRTNPHWDSRGRTQQNYPATHPRAPRVSGTPPGPLAHGGKQISFYQPRAERHPSLRPDALPRLITDYGRAPEAGG